MVLVGRLDIRTYWAPITFGNTGNLGLPVAFFAFGQVGFDFAVVIFAVMAILNFTFGVWVVAGGGSPPRRCASRWSGAPCSASSSW
jgi:malate permease and related proteins